MAKTYTCHFCGKNYSRTCDDTSYIGNNCFDCSFWIGKTEMPEEDEAKKIIVSGQHYMIGNDTTGPFRGFGGRKFTVSFHDGRIVETTNLWHQGTIPERFRKWFPDNAVFLQTAKNAQTIHTIDGGEYGLV